MALKGRKVVYCMCTDNLHTVNMHIIRFYYVLPKLSSSFCNGFPNLMSRQFSSAFWIGHNDYTITSPQLVNCSITCLWVARGLSGPWESWAKVLLQSELLLHCKSREEYVLLSGTLREWTVIVNHHNELFLSMMYTSCLAVLQIPRPHSLVHLESALSANASAKCFPSHSLPNHALVCSPAWELSKMA